MKALALAVLVISAACKPSKPMVEADAAAEPAPGAPEERNAAEKYVSGLQADVKRAQEAKAKADAANAQAQEANKLPE